MYKFSQTISTEVDPGLFTCARQVVMMLTRESLKVIRIRRVYRLLELGEFTGHKNWESLQSPECSTIKKSRGICLTDDLKYRGTKCPTSIIDWAKRRGPKVRDSMYDRCSVNYHHKTFIKCLST